MRPKGFHIATVKSVSSPCLYCSGGSVAINATLRHEQITAGAALSMEGEWMGWAVSVWGIAYGPHCAQELSIPSARTRRPRGRKNQLQMYPTKYISIFVGTERVDQQGSQNALQTLSLACYGHRRLRKMPCAAPLTLTHHSALVTLCTSSLSQISFLRYREETGSKFYKENLTFNRIVLILVWRFEKSEMKTTAQGLRSAQW